MHDEISKEDQARICAGGLVKTVEGISGTLINPHHCDVGTAPKRALHPCDRVICIRIRPEVASVHIHDAQFEFAQCAGNLSPTVDGNFLASNGINADLAAEEEQVVLPAKRKIEHAGHSPKKLPLFGEEELVGSEIERLCV